VRTLVIGGTGLVGHHASLLLAERGHDVVVAGRNRPDPAGPLAALEFVEGDYTTDDFDRDRLAGYDAVVFAAGQDVRHLGSGEPDAETWARLQSRSVPRLAQEARDAGVGRFVQVGSCYHMVRPDLVESNPYVQARRDADEGARALATPDFVACTLNPPPIVGLTPGASARRFARLVRWARGEADDRMPALIAPPGGTNYLSVLSLAEAIAGAIDRGEAGAAYLVGDENLTYQEYFQLLVDVAGGTGVVEVVDAEHPFLPDRMIVPGRSAVLRYEPSESDVQRLGYRRNDIRPMLEQMVADCGA
jgi:nucleoside-diphosphate-sugar epimerase